MSACAYAYALVKTSLSRSPSGSEPHFKDQLIAQCSWKVDFINPDCRDQSESNTYPLNIIEFRFPATPEVFLSPEPHVIFERSSDWIPSDNRLALSFSVKKSEVFVTLDQVISIRILQYFSSEFDGESVNKCSREFVHQKGIRMTTQF